MYKETTSQEDYNNVILLRKKLYKIVSKDYNSKTKYYIFFLRLPFNYKWYGNIELPYILIMDVTNRPCMLNYIYRHRSFKVVVVFSRANFSMILKTCTLRFLKWQHPDFGCTKHIYGTYSYKQLILIAIHKVNTVYSN